MVSSARYSRLTLSRRVGEKLCTVRTRGPNEGFASEGESNEQNTNSKCVAAKVVA